MTTDIENWSAKLADELGIKVDIDVDLLLNLAADTAHAVTRPAAPISAFLVGLAAGRNGATTDSIADAIATAREVAFQWDR